MPEGVLTDEVKSLRDEIVTTVTDYKSAIRKELDELKAKGFSDPETKENLTKVATRLDDLEARIKNPGSAGLPQLSKTIGQLFVESEDFQRFSQRGWHKGGAALRLKSFFNDARLPQLLEQKTTITTGTVGTAAPQNTRVPDIVTPLTRELRIRDLMSATPTTSSQIEYVEESTYTNAAAPQVEAAAKAESAMTFTLKTAPVRTIAHWIPASRQILDDMDMLMEYINGRLIYGLKLTEEAQLLSGDGTGSNLTGLITAATAYATTRNVVGDTKIDTISHAITQARVAEYPVDGVVLHPNDAEKIRLVKTEQGGVNKGSYIYGDPGSAAAPRIWNRPIVETTAIASGTFLVGAFMMGAHIWDRQEATIDVSTEHSDFFTKNLVAIRAEERLALTIYRPAAFVYGTFP